jgi:hypothetical protein
MRRAGVGGQRDRNRRADKGKHRKEQRKAREPAIVAAEKTWQHGRYHDTEQCESLAHRGDAGALYRIGG